MKRHSLISLVFLSITVVAFLVPTTLLFAASPEAVSVHTIGRVEIVFSSIKDHCNTNYTVDSPARAFRDADGQVNLIAAHSTTFRLIGRSLHPVIRDCTPVMISTNDLVYEHGQYHEWLSSVYTLDGKTVYGLVHDEWYAALVGSSCPETKGWLNFITLAKSDNGGRSYHHPAGDFVIIRPPQGWSDTFRCGTSYGGFEPSNVIKKGGYFYSAFRSAPDPLGHIKEGMCLMRTRDLSDVNAYELWSGKAWMNAKSTYCAPIQPDRLEHMHSSITYNIYLHTYVLVGVKLHPASGAGVYLSTSPDLMNWSEPVKIFDRNLDLTPTDKVLGIGTVNYPSILDPNDTSRNFENSGQDPYLYFMFENGKARYLLRQQIHLDFGSSSARQNSDVSK